MGKHTPVVAVIPHFNDAETLPGVVNELGAQNYTGIYVIDDASPERDAFEAAIEQFNGDGVRVIRGDRNVGSGANRNRILEDEKVRSAGRALLHFVDADVNVKSSDNPATIRDIFDDETIGMAGGLLLDKDGEQNVLNYGPSFSAAAHLGGLLQMQALKYVRQGKPEKAHRLHERFPKLLGQSPDITRPPEARDTTWVVECNLMIPSDDLVKSGGFPPIRHHETQGLSIEIAKAGLRTRFDERVVVEHEKEMGTLRRPLDQITGTLYLLRKYGVTRFMLDSEIAPQPPTNLAEYNQ